MTTPDLKLAALTEGAVATASTSQATDSPAIHDLIARIRDKDDKVRGPAWQSAASFGAPAVRPLGDLMSDPELEVGRAAKRALWKIVRQVGQPGLDRERQAVVEALLPLLSASPSPVRRDVLWMLSEIANDDAVPPMAALFADRELREDARASLERIPGRASLNALKAALKSAPEDFKPAIAQSLRVRGVRVSGYPSQKMVPAKPPAAEATPKP